MIFDTRALLFLPYSQFLYDITHNDGKSLAALIVKKKDQNDWKQGWYSHKIHSESSTLLVNRANYLIKMKTLSGGAPRRIFFKKHRALQLEGQRL